MDAYHAPYTKEARYWTGLLLLSRLGLFLTFAINTFGNNGVNILAVATVSAALLAIKRRVYEDWVKDILESSFILNLCITLIGILLYHVSLILKSSNIWKMHMLPFFQKFFFAQHHSQDYTS